MGTEKVSGEQHRAKMYGASYLLPDPGGEVVRGLIMELNISERRLAAAEGFMPHLLLAAEAGLSHMRSRNDPVALLATNAVADARAFLTPAEPQPERKCGTCVDDDKCGEEIDPLCNEPGHPQWRPERSCETLAEFVIQCWGCEGKPSGDNNPCDVCGRSAPEPKR